MSGWIRQRKDYKTVEELCSKSLSEFADTICFHSQQCAEKYLKALLVKCGIEPPWIHELESLLDLLASKIPEIEKIEVCSLNYPLTQLNIDIQEKRQKKKRLTHALR